MKSGSWDSVLYKAHEGFDDFSNILWEEMWDEKALRAERQVFIDDGDAAGYSQEYLNDPFDNSEAFLRKDDFQGMTEDQLDCRKKVAIGCDFAVSKADRANKTSFTVGGKGLDNLLHIFDQHSGKWDTLEWIDVMFDLQAKHRPEAFFVEDGVIWKSIAPTLYKEMQLRDCWLNCQPIPSIKDKASRARPFQKRMRAGGMRFDKKAEWYPGYEGVLLRFTGRSDAVQDDEFDSTAILVKGFDLLAELEEEDFLEEEEVELRAHDPRKVLGRSKVTGY
jgi:predicted phage terminase large subunit-like protein